MHKEDETKAAEAYALFQRVSNFFGSPHAASKWYAEPNQAFEGRTPNDVIVDGEIERLWAMVFYLESGVAS